MNFKKLFFTMALCFGVVAMASAQTVKGAEAQTKRGPYETNRLFDNIFVGVAGGVNYYQGEEDCRADFSDRMAPALTAYVGKWFTPCVGARITYSGLKAEGFTTNVNNGFVDGTNAPGYKQKFNFAYMHVDAMWNISNAISGYRSDRFWDIAPYAGGGLARSWANNKPYNQHNALAVTAGIYSMFRVTKALDVTLDISQTYVHQGFDGEAYKSRQEYIGSVTVGLAYQFKNREFSRAHAAVDVTGYNNKINDLNKALADANSKNAQLEKDLRDANNKPAKEVVVNNGSKKVATPVALFFPIGKSTLDATQMMNLDFYVQNAIKVDAKHTFTITGSADSATGTKKINDRLGEQRMQKVYDILVNKYGISADRLSKKAIGGTDKYSSSNAKLNRCVVID